MKLLLAVIFAIASVSAFAEWEVVTFVRHNGMVTELKGLSKDFDAIGRSTRYFAFTANALSYDAANMSEEDQAAYRASDRYTSWSRDGDIITIYSEAGVEMFVTHADAIECRIVNTSGETIGDEVERTEEI